MGFFLVGLYLYFLAWVYALIMIIRLDYKNEHPKKDKDKKVRDRKIDRSK